MTHSRAVSSGAYPALAADGTLYVGSDKLYALDGDTGGLKWAFEASGHVGSPNIGPDGTIYFGVSNSESNSGIYAVHGTAPLADTPWPKFQHDAQHRGRQVTSGAAAITRSPVDRWVAVDAPTTFSFYSPVIRPLQVQWRFNGEDIPGATNETLKIERVRFEDAGRYSVVISNQFGGDLSAEALLNVGYSLQTSTNGRGTIQITPDLAVYPTNTVVQLAATPDSPRAFQGWQGTIASAGNLLT
ncbi:MAG TPA: PQQ-binding-like beta-propeller repeat protein, partial [Verrucomicrobiae bacterium]|nr:PQQ-binding-like beta-propeller repeat protein [Verrucomicrobiae bacterium]